MRKTVPLLIAAALVVSGPASAQDNDAANATTADAVDPGNTVDTASGATAPTNGLTAGPGAVPETLPDTAVDTTATDRADDDGGFPWGVLGLLGLLGLIPRRNAH